MPAQFAFNVAASSGRGAGFHAWILTRPRMPSIGSIGLGLSVATWGLFVVTCTADPCWFGMDIHCCLYSGTRRWYVQDKTTFIQYKTHLVSYLGIGLFGLYFLLNSVSYERATKVRSNRRRKLMFPIETGTDSGLQQLRPVAHKEWCAREIKKCGRGARHASEFGQARRGRHYKTSFTFQA